MIYDNMYCFSDEDEGLDLPIIEKHSKSIKVESDDYLKVLEILQKKSGPRFSVMKEDMKEGGNGKKYSYYVEKHISKFYCILDFKG